jgi:hypothetical protein
MTDQILDSVLSSFEFASENTTDNLMDPQTDRKTCAYCGSTINPVAVVEGTWRFMCDCTEAVKQREYVLELKERRTEIDSLIGERRKMAMESLLSAYKGVYQTHLPERDEHIRKMDEEIMTLQIGDFDGR